MATARSPSTAIQVRSGLLSGPDMRRSKSSIDSVRMGTVDGMSCLVIESSS